MAPWCRLGAADFSKAGDRGAGLAAPTEVVREAARTILSSLTLQHLYDRPLTDDEGRVEPGPHDAALVPRHHGRRMVNIPHRARRLLSRGDRTGRASIPRSQTIKTLAVAG